ncbi:HIT family protein [Marinicella sp. W31]|uniref:HIT family protein n=1 Tax=Marinicella sp. W31 TaxID=3023713 RepID=UPI003757695C
MSYDNDNIFAKILRQEAPCIPVYEDTHSFAMMDIMPQTEGHVLVIPKEAATTVYDLSAEALTACMLTVQKVGKAVEKALQVEGSSLFQLNGRVAGQTVPHAHFHVIPGSLLALKGHAAEQADPAQLQKIAEKIKATLDTE